MSLSSAARARNARRQFLYALQTRNEHDLYGPVDTVLTQQCDLAMTRDKNRAFYCNPQGVVSIEAEYKLSEIAQRLDPDFEPSPSATEDVGGRRRTLRTRGNGDVDKRQHPQQPSDRVADEVLNDGEGHQAGPHDETEQQQEVEEVGGGIGDDADDAPLPELPGYVHNLHAPVDHNENLEDLEENDPPVTGPSLSVTAPSSPAHPSISAPLRLSAASKASHTSAVTTTSSTSGTQTTFTTISNDSKRVVRFTRFPDFRIDMALVDEKDKEVGRHTIAIAEVKISRPTEDEGDDQRKGSTAVAAKVADEMLPQVIQAVQVVFANDLVIDEVVAMLIVDEFCRFMYFRREDVVELDPISDGRGFKDPEDHAAGKQLWKKLRNFAHYYTGMLQMVHGVRADVAVKFGGTFVREFTDLVNWAQGKKEDSDEYRFPFPEQ